MLSCLRERTLMWLALCHLALGAPGATLKCFDALLSVQAPCTADAAYQRLRLEALLLEGTHREVRLNCAYLFAALCYCALRTTSFFLSFVHAAQ